MTTRKGTLLETNVEQLLKLSGFNPILNRIYNGYEIDVFLIYKNLKIAFECKQYERSTLAIRNLIHQWESKNRELNFDKIVLVLVGCDISNKEYSLAKKHGIIIWDEQKFTNLLNKSIEKKTENKDTILKELGIEKDEIKEVEEKFEIEETEQQIIIKEALAKMLKRGKRGLWGAVIFEEIGTDFFVQYSLDEKGFMLCFPEPDSTAKEVFNYDHFNNTINLLKSLKFELRKELDVGELNNNEFVITDDELYAKCGDDVDFIAYLSDRIFRDVFKTEDDYKIKIKVE